MGGLADSVCPGAIVNITNNMQKLTFFIKAIYSVDAGTLVVSSQKEEVLRVLDLVRQKEADCLKGLLPAIHVVSQEEVV